MSETVIVLQESSVLIGKGKSGQIPKLQETRKIPMEGYGNLIEQWDNVLINYQKSHKGEQIRLVLPAGYSSQQNPICHRKTAESDGGKSSGRRLPGWDS